jgi:hypothetical protein
VHVASGTDERSRRMTGQQYDAIAANSSTRSRGCARLTRGGGRGAICRAFRSAVSLMARTGRDADLSDGECADDDVEEVIARRPHLHRRRHSALAARNGRRQQ